MNNGERLLLLGVVIFFVSHFLAKYLQKVSGNNQDSFYAEALIIIMIVLYGAFFLFSSRLFL